MTFLEWLTANKDILSWLGGGIAAAAGGVWAVIRYIIPSRPPAPGERDNTFGMVDARIGEFIRRPNPSDLVPKASPGLAVGYFYNFLYLIDNKMVTGSFTYTDAESNLKSVPYGNIRIHIIVPRRLEGGAFSLCETECRNALRGTFEYGDRRTYGFNYIDALGTLQIVDFARPLIAVKWFYEQVVQIKPNDQLWTKIEEIEIEAFKVTIQKLVHLGEGRLNNVISFSDRG